VSADDTFGRDLAAGLIRDRLEQTMLMRDVDATSIPGGETVAIESGTEVTILQANGGGYTIQVPLLGTTCRIEAADVDALGKRLAEHARTEDGPADGGETNDASPDSLRRQVDGALRRVYDPELPLSVVDLGLIYDLRLIETDVATYRVEIEMTLTTQACGMGPTITREMRERLTDLPRVGDVRIDIVWEPQWTPQRISDEGRKKLGIA
jgi:probable FeS assembly SUF system protein SufT